MANVLVTGGAGFIGTYLVNKLLQDGHNVKVLDILSPQIHGENIYFPPKGALFYKGCITDFELVNSLVDDIDIVYHLAAETGTGQSMYEIRNYVNINEYGTSVLLEALSRHIDKRPIKFILSSSRSIYGEGLYCDNSGKIYHPDTRTKETLSNKIFDFCDEYGVTLTPIATNESCPAKPGSIYAATKYSQELLCKVYANAHPNFDLKILRFQNVYGAGQSLQNPYTGIISIFYNRIRQGLPINIYEDGLESRDFVYVTDVVSALINVLNSDSKDNLVLNIGHGVKTTVIELVETYYKILAKDTNYFISGDFRVGDIRNNFADLSLAKQHIQYSPKVSLFDGLSLFVDWATTQPEYQDKSEVALSELKAKGLSV
jgi:dTDP-L-rhamnose 4-epimerase